MKRSWSSLRRLLPVAAGALALLACTSASAQATWGEFAPHFRLSTGTGPGQIAYEGRTSTLALTVNPSDRSYFVADQPKTGEYRIQRFAGGAAGASIAFKPKVPPETETGVGGTNEGLEITTANNRVYALVLSRRRPQNKKELKAEEEEEAQYLLEKKEEEEGKKPIGTRLIKAPHPHFPLDAEELVAGQLFAFEYTGGKLVSASANKETGEPTAVITEGQLKVQTEVPREALLTPRGLTVDPTSGNVAILGAQDEQSNEKVEKGEGEKECRAAAQFATPVVTAGVLKGAKLARRYVDRQNALLPGQPTCSEQEVSEVPFSPAVTPAGNLLFAAGGEGETQVWEMQTPGTGAGEGETEETPRRLFAESALATTHFELQNLAGEAPAATLSFVPEGPKQGRIYIAGDKNGFAQAPVALQYAEGEGGSPSKVTELGWTAGGEAPPCGMPQQLAEGSLLGGFREGAGGAGKEGVLVLDAFAELSTGTPRVETYAFGPGGSTEHCPSVTVSPPTATFGLDKNAREVPAGQVVALATTVTGANAKSTEWKLTHEDLVTKKPVTEVFNTGYQLETGPATLEHEFTQVGTYEITAVVTSDNLAREPVTSEETLKLTVTASSPSIKFAAPKAVRVNEESLELSATVKDPNEGSTVTLKKVQWSFGDGSAPVEGKLEPHQPNPIAVHVTHTFLSRCGKGTCPVTLTVEDAAGQTAKSTVDVTVTESLKEAQEAKERQEAHERQLREAQEAIERQEAHERQVAKEAQEAKERLAAKEAQEVKERKEQEEKARGGVLAFVARVAGSTFPVNTSGAVTFKLSCQTGASSCTGTVTLRTLTAVSAGGKHKVVLTLASGSFSLTGGQTKVLTLHLSSKARVLLARARVLRARATVVSRASNGTSQATQAVVTLKLVKKHH